jgi:TonB family protein
MAFPARVFLVVFLLVCGGGLAGAAPPENASDASPELPVEPTVPQGADGFDPEHAPSLPQIILTSQVIPTYPPAALAARFTGTVVVRLTIQSDGSVGDATVVECDHPNLGFENATLAAVRRWKFEPAALDGQPIPYVMNFRLNFRTDGTGRNQRAYVSASAGPQSDVANRAPIDTQQAPTRTDPTVGLGSRK